MARIKWVFYNGWDLLLTGFCNLPILLFGIALLSRIFMKQICFDNIWDSRTCISCLPLTRISLWTENIILNNTPYIYKLSTGTSGAGGNINDTGVQSHVSFFFLLEICVICIVPLWYIKVERSKELLSWSMEILCLGQRHLPW